MNQTNSNQLIISASSIAIIRSLRIDHEAREVQRLRIRRRQQLVGAHRDAGFWRMKATLRQDTTRTDIRIYTSKVNHVVHFLRWLP